MSRSGLQDYGKLIELPVQKKLSSLLAGRHGGERSGASHEFLDMAEYKIGDDISDIDWKTSARHNQAIIKRFESTAVMNVYLLVDGGANMAALASGSSQLLDGAEEITKGDVAEEFCTAISWLTAARGDMLGMIIGDSERVRTIPARSGLAHAEMILRLVRLPKTSGPAPDLLGLLRQSDVCLRRRSLVLLVTDRGQINPQIIKPLKRILTRHRILALLAEDFDPTKADIPQDLADVSAGALPDFVKTDPTISYQWGNAITAQEQRAEQILRDLRIPFATAGNPADVLLALQKLTREEHRGPVFA